MALSRDKTLIPETCSNHGPPVSSNHIYEVTCSDDSALNLMESQHSSGVDKKEVVQSPHSLEDKPKKNAIKTKTTVAPQTPTHTICSSQVEFVQLITPFPKADGILID
jgi:hypothetical protein